MELKLQKKKLKKLKEGKSSQTGLSNQDICLKKFKGIKFNSKQIQNDHLKEIKIHQNIVLEDLDKDIDEKLIYSLFNIIDLDNTIEKNIKNLSDYKNKKIKDITVCLLDRDRHFEIINSIKKIGAKVTSLSSDKTW